LKIGFTYNIKKETETIQQHVNAVAEEKKDFINDNVVEKYASRISDTYAEWDDEETISAVESALKKTGHDVIR
jgi:hypothetical protein